MQAIGVGVGDIGIGAFDPPGEIGANEQIEDPVDAIGRDPAFLLHRRGTRIAPSTLHPWFAHARTAAGIPCLPGHRRPRAYDLRHTFAVHTLRDWHASGLDVRQQLPVLSSYLGHVNPDNTYWYLQAVPELMNVLADRLSRYLNDDDGAVDGELS